ncbi:MAG: glutaredoxin family protein [Nocardioidaceae bacterium]
MTCDSAAGTPRERVLVYGKPGCHLCATAEEVVTAVCAELGVSWRRVDISRDAALMRHYGEQIPVVFVDGRQHDFWRVDSARLRAALTAHP